MRVRQIAFVFCLLSFALGCDGDRAAASSSAVVTNVVTVTREVVVTNRVTETVTVTNVVVERREPTRILSVRKTAPYAVAASALDDRRLRRLVSDSGARVISCENGAVAVVEASDRAVGVLKGVADVRELTAEDKIAVDAGAAVRIIPLSTIDAAEVTKAVRSVGGELVQVVTSGQPCIRAKVSYSGLRKLAARGDVRRIERDKR